MTTRDAIIFLAGMWVGWLIYRPLGTITYRAVERLYRGRRARGRV
jgi:hypothetical protein